MIANKPTNKPTNKTQLQLLFTCITKFEILKVMFLFNLLITYILLL